MDLQEWTAAQVEPSEDESPPSPGEWHEVDVPGHPDRFTGADAVAYRTAFPDPREGDDARAVVELRGLFAHARVWHDGELLGHHDAYFIPARFEIDPAAENELVVECRAPEGRFGGVHDTDLVREDQRVPGIWWGAEASGHPESFLADLTVVPDLSDDGTSIEARVTVDAGADLDDRITFSVRPEGFRGGGMMQRAPVTAEAGERVTVERSIDVRDPSLWWPRGLGPQHYYNVRAKLGGSSRETSSGLRTVAYDADGLRVNGERLAARGFNVLPGDETEADVSAAVEANANLLRAHAHVPPRSFHRACDEAGVLVWQDLPLTGPGSFDVGRARALAEGLVGEYGHHPSVAAFGVHDDPAEAFADPLGTGRLDRYRFRWRAWRSGYDRSDADRVAEAFPDDRPTFPVAGEPGTGADAAHVYPGWRYGTPGDVSWLLDRYPDFGRVVGEFGAAALADGEHDTVGETAGFDAAVHDLHVDGDAATSQAYQARVLKTVAEGLRRHGSHALAAFALRDTGDAGMGVLARDGTEKAGYGAIAASYRPQVAVLHEYPTPGSTVLASAVNDAADPLEATVAWSAGDREDAVEVSLEPFERVGIGSVAVPTDAESVELALRPADGEPTTNTYPL
jgi:hypothetical protein